ncbi:MAG: DUF3501 family protein [Deltaproteobacteria bacterium]|nr:DUF3501 family protein [Deltaproteobacteria bacterium]
MEKISLDDIMGLEAYEKVRNDFRRRIIELKKKRRLSVGDKVSLVFENRETLIFQIQEMVRAENISDLDKIREEIQVYNGLIPDPGELSATLFLEMEEQSHLREQLLKFLGIDEVVYLKIGDQHSIHARFEEGHSKEDKISAVQYVRFPLGPEQIKAFSEEKEGTKLVIDHPNYRAETVIGPETRKSLMEDLAAQGA